MPVGLFGKATSIERKIKKLLNKLSKEYHFRYHVNHSIKGGYNVDFYINSLDMVIEANGDYYHAWSGIYKEKNQLNEMQIKNLDRDKKKQPWLELHNLMIFWEHDINKRDFGKRFSKLFKEAEERIKNGSKFQYFGD